MPRKLQEALHEVAQASHFTFITCQPPMCQARLLHGLGMCHNCPILKLSNMLLLIPFLQPYRLFRILQNTISHFHVMTIFLSMLIAWYGALFISHKAKAMNSA